MKHLGPTFSCHCLVNNRWHSHTTCKLLRSIGDHWWLTSFIFVYVDIKYRNDKSFHRKKARSLKSGFLLAPFRQMTSSKYTLAAPCWTFLPALLSSSLYFCTRLHFKQYFCTDYISNYISYCSSPLQCTPLYSIWKRQLSEGPSICIYICTNLNDNLQNFCTAHSADSKATFKLTALLPECLLHFLTHWLYLTIYFYTSPHS